MTERYNRPVLVGSKKDKIVKGSARSIGDFNIANALKKLDDLLIAHGGHALAAGFTLPYSNLEEFEKRLNYLSSESLSDEMLVKSLKIDAIANPEDLTIQTARKLLQFSTFGFGNPKPILALLDAKIDGWQKLGSNGSHMKLRIITAPNSNNFIEAIAFNYSDYIDEKTLDAKALDFAFYLDINSWNGNEKIQLVIKAIKESRPTILSSDEE